MRRNNNPKCPLCDSRSHKWGKNSAGVALYRCAICNKNFVKDGLSSTRRRRLDYPDTETQHYCMRCNRYLNFSEFVFDKKTESYYTYCRSCRRDRDMERIYGLSISDIQEMLFNQNNKCAICKIEFTEDFNGRYRVDHDHKTGNVRGLLCNDCNRALGLFKDDKSALSTAIEYLS